MNTDYALFALDVDGTLLERNGVLTSSTRGFLAELSRHSRVTLATGRSISSALPWIDELAITTPAILYHGAVIYDPVGKRALHEAYIPGPQIYRSLEDPVVYVSEMTAPIRTFLKKEGILGKIIDDETELLTAGVIKLLFIGDPEELPDFEEELRTVVPELTIMRSESKYVEVLPPEASKGAALAWLCQYLDIPLERTVAVGDQMIDLSMIERAGLGVAMAHSGSELQVRADAVISQISELEALLNGRTE